MNKSARVCDQTLNKNDFQLKPQQNKPGFKAHSDLSGFRLVPMPHLLIVESEFPAIAGSLSTTGKISSADHYARVFTSISDQLTFNIICPYANGFEPLSVDYDAYDGIVFTGSDVPWSVDAPEALALRQTMEAALTAQKPVFGSCNGLQLATVVLGGECQKVR